MTIFRKSESIPEIVHFSASEEMLHHTLATKAENSSCACKARYYTIANCFFRCCGAKGIGSMGRRQGRCMKPKIWTISAVSYCSSSCISTCCCALTLGLHTYCYEYKGWKKDQVRVVPHVQYCTPVIPARQQMA